jgi:hypothetical protein
MGNDFAGSGVGFGNGGARMHGKASDGRLAEIVRPFDGRPLGMQLLGHQVAESPRASTFQSARNPTA